MMKSSCTTEGNAIADCLETVASNGGDMESPEFLSTVAQELEDHARYIKNELARITKPLDSGQIMVRIHLNALTAETFSQDIEMSEDATDADLDHLVQTVWDETCGSEYESVPSYWEKGTCYWERLNDEGKPIG